MKGQSEREIVILFVRKRGVCVCVKEREREREREEGSMHELGLWYA